MIEVKLVNAPKPKPRGLSGLLVKWGGVREIFAHAFCNALRPRFDDGRLA